MKQLNKTQSALFVAGGVLMVIGAGSYAATWMQQVACWVFLTGSLLFTIMQQMQSYEGQNFVIRRLKNIMSFAHLCFVLSGLLMADSAYGFMLRAFSNYMDYYTYLYNKWVVLLLVAAILEVYTMHRIDNELKKEDNSDSKQTKQ